MYSQNSNVQGVQHKYMQSKTGYYQHLSFIDSLVKFLTNYTYSSSDVTKKNKYGVMITVPERLTCDNNSLVLQSLTEEQHTENTFFCHDCSLINQCTAKVKTPEQFFILFCVLLRSEEMKNVENKHTNKIHAYVLTFPQCFSIYIFL